MLQKVSRSFALVIQQLGPELRNAVSTNSFRLPPLFSSVQHEFADRRAAGARVALREPVAGPGRRADRDGHRLGLRRGCLSGHLVLSDHRPRHPDAFELE